jgi:hypothetical protein
MNVALCILACLWFDLEFMSCYGAGLADLEWKLNYVTSAEDEKIQQHGYWRVFILLVPRLSVSNLNHFVFQTQPHYHQSSDFVCHTIQI